jgi:hypothetical protein
MVTDLAFTQQTIANDKQAPKTNCTPAKLTAALTYMQKSRVAHTIKDLEKHLPSVAQINGMQVKGMAASLSWREVFSMLTKCYRLRPIPPR